MMEQPMECSEEDDENVLSLLEYLPSDVLLEIFTYLAWNDVCQVACTCTKFRDICNSASLWLSLRYLDFRNCAIPLPAKILQILNRTPNASHISLGQIITDEKAVSGSEFSSDDEQAAVNDQDEHKDNLKESDRFVLNVLKSCPKIVHLQLCMSNITDMSVNAICAKCTVLQELTICDNTNISARAVCELVSMNTTLRNLAIESCEDLNFLNLAHTNSSQRLALQRISMQGQSLTMSNIVTMINSCPMLTHLNLTGCAHLETFSLDPSAPNPHIPIVRAGLECLQVLILNHCIALNKVSLPYCPNLTQLDVSGCINLEEIVGNAPSLQCLETGSKEHNRYKKISLTSSSLQALSCDNMTALETLDISSNTLCELNLQSCAKLSAAQVLSTILNKQCLTSLNICGCKNISPSDVNDIILPQLTSLQNLQYGGYSWNSVALKSSIVTDLKYSDCINTTCLLLNIPQLVNLTLKNCRDFNEQELMDSFLYGKLVTRMQGLENIITEHREKPFINDTGIPLLLSLKFLHLPGLHGDVISNNLHHFSHLRTVEFIKCTFLSHLSIHSWPSLTDLRIESCNTLSTLSVKHTSTLQNLSVKWCSMLQMCTIHGVNLEHLDVTGTSFVDLTVICDNLQSLHLNGICTQPQHKICLRCRNLTELSIIKCDRLTDEVLNDIFINNGCLKFVNLVGSLSLKSMCLPEGIEVCSLTGHRMLRELKTSAIIKIKHLTLNNLPKFVPSDRMCFLKQCEQTLKILEVRAIPGETTLFLPLHGLQSLTLDQGIHLTSLEISCPRLKYLRIQGCPKLVSLTLHVESLTKMQVYHSTPLLALRRLSVYSKHVVHLARVLAHYTPKLEELSLHGSEVKGSQLYRLGQSLHNLQTVTLDHCNVSQFDNYGQTSFLIDSTTINRPKDKHLLVQFIE